MTKRYLHLAETSARSSEIPRRGNIAHSPWTLTLSFSSAWKHVSPSSLSPRERKDWQCFHFRTASVDPSARAPHLCKSWLAIPSYRFKISESDMVPSPEKARHSQPGRAKVSRAILQLHVDSSIRIHPDCGPRPRDIPSVELVHPVDGQDARKARPPSSM